jgi:hypothetical protein
MVLPTLPGEIGESECSIFFFFFILLFSCLLERVGKTISPLSPPTTSYDAGQDSDQMRTIEGPDVIAERLFHLSDRPAEEVKLLIGRLSLLKISFLLPMLLEESSVDRLRR